MASFKLQSFVNEWLNSWTGNNPEKLISYYNNDILYSDPANPDGINNLPDLRIYFEKLLAKNPNWKWSSQEIIPTDKGCVLKWKAQIPVKNKSIVMSGIDIIEIKNNLIIRNEVFFDRVPWFNALNTG